MKVLIVSGFLGAGKTTFIKELYNRVKKNIVILENEYGQENIDSSILNEKENMNICTLFHQAVGGRFDAVVNM